MVNCRYLVVANAARRTGRWNDGVAIKSAAQPPAFEIQGQSQGPSETLPPPETFETQPVGLFPNMYNESPGGLNNTDSLQRVTSKSEDHVPALARYLEDMPCTGLELLYTSN